MRLSPFRAGRRKQGPAAGMPAWIPAWQAGGPLYGAPGPARWGTVLGARLNTVNLIAALFRGAASQAAASRLFSTLGGGPSARLDTSVESLEFGPSLDKEHFCAFLL